MVPLPGKERRPPKKTARRYFRARAPSLARRAAPSALTYHRTGAGIGRQGWEFDRADAQDSPVLKPHYCVG